MGYLPLWIVASIIYRKRKGKTLPRLPPEDILFEERLASKTSLKSPWSRIGGARNSLTVAVTRDEVLIWPPFPFYLGFMPEIYDLEHRILRTAIRSVAMVQAWGQTAILLEFADSSGRLRRLRLRLRKPQEFLAALGPVGGVLLDEVAAGPPAEIGRPGLDSNQGKG